MSNVHNGVTIRSFLKSFVEQGGIYRVDDQSYVLYTPDNSKIPLEYEDGTKYISIYDPSQVNTDVAVFNPFVEGLEMTTEKQWFYTTQSLQLAGVLYRAMQGIINQVCLCKSNKGESDLSVNTANVLAPFMQIGIDTKMETELDAMIKQEEMAAFFNIFYSQKQKHQTVNIGINEDNYISKFKTSTVRKKTWDVLRKMVSIIFGTDDPRTDYATKPTVTGCPRFSSYTAIVIRILRSLEPYLQFQNKVFNIDVLESHFPKLNEYYNTAKFFINTAPTNKTLAPVPGQAMAASPVAPWGAYPNIGPALAPTLSVAPVGFTDMMHSSYVQSPLLAAGSPMQASPMTTTTTTTTTAPVPTSALAAHIPTPNPMMMPVMSPPMNMMGGQPMQMAAGNAPMIAPVMTPQTMPPMMNTGYMGAPMVQPAMQHVPGYYAPVPQYQQPTRVVQTGSTGIQIESPLTVSENTNRNPLL